MAERIEGLNLVLLGKIGAGKSASGNTILGREAFESKKGFSSVTQDVAVESEWVCGRQVNVYDTPGLFNTKLSEQEIQKIYANVLQRCKSDLCAFLLVIKADRFTEKEKKTVEKIEELLGEARLKKTWILFTRGDELEEENNSIDEFINETKALKKLVQKYDQRYHVFNNKKREHTEQVKMLLTKIYSTYPDTIEKGANPKPPVVERRQLCIPGPTIPVKTPLRMPEMSPYKGAKPKQTPVDGQECIPQPMSKTPLKTPEMSPCSPQIVSSIVLLGQTGVGKSAAGNTILGQREFRSLRSTNSVTCECSLKHATVSGRSVSVVDTPGLYHTELNSEELEKEMMRSVYISSPGPHAFLIMIRVDVRFTDQELQIPQMIKTLFGQEVFKYSIVLFTRGDQLRGESVVKLIEENSILRDLVGQCGGRFYVFNNRDENNSENVNDLLKKIDTMIEQNGGGHYSHQMIEDAQRLRREEEEETQREEEERKQQEERQRQEEIEREIKTTVDRIRAEMEAKAVRRRAENRRKQKDSCVCS